MSDEQGPAAGDGDEGMMFCLICDGISWWDMVWNIKKTVFLCRFIMFVLYPTEKKIQKAVFSLVAWFTYHVAKIQTVIGAFRGKCNKIVLFGGIYEVLFFLCSFSS